MSKRRIIFSMLAAALAASLITTPTQVSARIHTDARYDADSVNGCLTPMHAGAVDFWYRGHTRVTLKNIAGDNIVRDYFYDGPGYRHALYKGNYAISGVTVYASTEPVHPDGDPYMDAYIEDAICVDIPQNI